MFSRLNQLRRDERGFSFVFVGAGFMGFLAATTIAIDVGMMMTARSQAQTAADASALAGAVALAFNNNVDTSTSGPAVQSALNTATSSGNHVLGQAVSIQSSDVTFENDASGKPYRVHVQVFRSSARGNAVSTLMGSMFGINSVDVGATAVAEATLANAENCVKPWAVPDKWTERQTPPWDTGDTFSAFPSNPSVFPDIYRTASAAGYTGYTTSANTGTTITLTSDVGNTITPGMFFAIRLPGSSGETDFTNNITGCSQSKMTLGANLSIEPSATSNDTATAAAALIAQDPSAYWNAASNQVVSTLNPSPRVVVVPAYDPLYFDQGKKVGNFTQLKVANFIGLFLDHVEGNNVVTRITPIAGLVDTSVGAAPAGAFPRAIRLVQ
jgi:hypothetical protein